MVPFIPSAALATVTHPIFYSQLYLRNAGFHQHFFRGFPWGFFLGKNTFFVDV